MFSTKLEKGKLRVTWIKINHKYEKQRKLPCCRPVLLALLCGIHCSLYKPEMILTINVSFSMEKRLCSKGRNILSSAGQRLKF